MKGILIKRLSALLAACAVTMCAFAAERVLAPDFAYPKTVLKSADSLYDVSVRSGDVLGQLEALMLSGEANSLIDRQTRPRTIKRVMDVASGLKDKQMRALFDLYAARLLSNYYRSNRWQFNQRELPLTPRPADMSEWSGNMFNSLIDSLCLSAWNNAGDMPLASLTRVIEADRLTLQYFPTLSDFVASASGEILDYGALTVRIAEESMLRAKPESPRYYYLLGEKLGNSNIKGWLNIAEAYAKAQNKYNALVMWQFVQPYLADDNYRTNKKTVETALDEALKVGSGSWIEPLLRNQKKELLQKTAEVRISRIIPSGSPADVSVDVRNIDTLVLTAKRYADYQSWINARSPRKNVRPVSTGNFIYRLGGKADTTLKISLETGYYILSAKGLEGSVATMATPFVPVYTSTKTGRHLTVADAVTGRPVSGVTTVLMQKGKARWQGVTDTDGRVTIPNDRRGDLVLKKGTVSLMYENMGCSVLPKANNTLRGIDFNLTTDLSVVSPGDSIRWLLAAGGDGKMAEGLDLDVVLSDEVEENIDTVRVVTDSYGRATGSFLVPADSETGTFSIEAFEHNHNGPSPCGLTNFEVADFKLLGARLTQITAVPDGNKVTISGKLSNYSGTGLAGSEIMMGLELESDDREADTTLVKTGLTGSDGKFSLVFAIPDGTGWCRAEITATAPDGTTVTDYKSFNARYRASLNAYLIGGENVDASRGLDIEAVVIAAAGDTIKAPLNYRLMRLNDDKEILSGEVMSAPKVKINLDSKIVPGKYTLDLAPVDTTLCMSKRFYVVTIYRTDTDKLPVESVMWMPNDSLIGLSTSVWLTAAFNTKDGGCRFETHELKGGYHNLYEVFDLSDAIYGDELTLFTVHNGATVGKTLPIKKRSTKKINITLESFRDKVVSGGKESWTLRVTDAKGRGVDAAVAVNVYDSRLDQLRAPRIFRVYISSPNLYSLSVRRADGNLWGTFEQRLTLEDVVSVEAPQWRWISSPYGMVMYKSNRLNARIYSSRAPMATVDMAVAKNEAVETESEMEAGDIQIDEDKATTGGSELLGDVVPAYGFSDGTIEVKTLDDVVLRIDDKYSALWQPMLTTGADGRLTVPFDVPNSNTMWQMMVSAWTKEGYSTAIRRTFVSNKPVTVSLNAPQFVRAGDEVTVQALLVNTTDAAREVDVRLESIASDSETPDVYTRTVTLPAMGNTALPIEVKVPVTADSVRFVIRALSGNNSDGEAVALAVLPSQSRVTESRNFYLNPGQDSWSAEVPAQQDSAFEAELSYTGNPMWTVVSSLPELTGDVLPTAVSQANAYFGAAIALSLMKEHPELEIKFNKSDLKRTMDGARKVLGDLQNSDGGWKWGEWSSRSSVYVTAQVLDQMATLKRAGMLDDSRMESMIKRALPYYDDEVEHTDMRYVITRSAFATPAMSLNGRKVSNATIQYINKNWKKFTIPEKALAACALEYSGNKSMARTLMGSLDQFGTQTADKGFEFMNVSSLQTYAWLLECYGAIVPKSQIVDGIRQYLIVRRQGEAWGNNTVTSFIVASMINSGTPWTVPAGKVTVSVDGRDTVPAMQDKLGRFDIRLDGRSVKLTRSDATTPAYGALITRYTAPSAEVRAFSDGEISIEKKLNVQNADGTWRAFDAATDTLRVGQKVRTLLTVKTDRPMSRVIVTDQRAATFVPVIQLSGWVYGDGISAYRENRTAATNLYLEYVPKGTWMLTYDFTVNNAGTFNSGVAVATCSEAPALTAHSSGCLLHVAR